VWGLDPCGSWHNPDDPESASIPSGGPTPQRCLAYWAAMDEAAARLGGTAGQVGWTPDPDQIWLILPPLDDEGDEEDEPDEPA
jgi:hypothetical protein